MTGNESDIVVIPGENVTELLKSRSEHKKIIVGPGLRRVADDVIACNSGVLKCKGSNLFWVDCHKGQYIPVKNEKVVGVVTNKSVDNFKVDIGCSDQANITYTEFVGATKKNRPRLEVGDVIFARLLDANRDMEPELSCKSVNEKRDNLGILSNDGFLFSCNLNLANKLRSKYGPIFDELGKSIPYEIAVGSNGKIWINSPSIHNTIKIYNVILISEYKTYDEVKKLVDKIKQSV